MAVVEKARQPLGVDQRLDFSGVREGEFELEPVVFADLVEVTVGLRVQAAGVEREGAERDAEPRRHVDQHHVLGAAERDRDVFELLEGLLEDLLWLGVGEAARELRDLGSAAVAHALTPRVGAVGRAARMGKRYQSVLITKKNQ